MFTANCSYQLTAPRGVVTSPDYPSYYDPHSNCSWLIDVGSGNATIKFNSFMFQHDELCEQDKFEVRYKWEMHILAVHIIQKLVLTL